MLLSDWKVRSKPAHYSGSRWWPERSCTCQLILVWLFMYFSSHLSFPGAGSQTWDWNLRGNGSYLSFHSILFLSNGWLQFLAWKVASSGPKSRKKWEEPSDFVLKWKPYHLSSLWSCPSHRETSRRYFSSGIKFPGERREKERKTLLEIYMSVALSSRLLQKTFFPRWGQGYLW